MVLGSISRAGCITIGGRLHAQSSVRGFSTSISRRVERALPNAPARTRFAPSPTGYLHLGSLRTALYNFLLAKATGGQFILRVEDTDVTRTVADAESRLCEDLRWAGIEWDEGPDIGGPLGPYRQSERTGLYKDHADILIASGNAYRCFCSAKKLNEQAKIRQQLNLPTTYDRTCESIPIDVANQRAANGEEHTVRLRSPQVYPRFRDLVYGGVGGKAKVSIGGFDDPILLKSDGMPTYHLANVVDDHHMHVTHVVRGVEWMPSTPRHLALYSAFGWEPPAFAHVGLLQDSQGQKLSKRGSATDIRTLARDGIFPEALTNYVALLGWSHKEKSDFLPLSGLINMFDMKFTKGNTIVGPQKLTYLQRMYAQKHIQHGGPQFQDLLNRVCERVRTSELFDRSKIPIPPQHDLQTYIISILQADSKHFTSIDSFLLRNEAFFRDTLIRISSISSDGPGGSTLQLLEAAQSQFAEISRDQWVEEKIRDAVQQLIDRLSQSISDSGNATKDPLIDIGKSIGTRVNHVLRWAIFAGNPGPPMANTMVILGRESALKRLKEAHEECQSSNLA